MQFFASILFILSFLDTLLCKSNNSLHFKLIRFIHTWMNAWKTRQDYTFKQTPWWSAGHHIMTLQMQHTEEGIRKGKYSLQIWKNKQTNKQPTSFWVTNLPVMRMGGDVWVPWLMGITGCLEIVGKKVAVGGHTRARRARCQKRRAPRWAEGTVQAWLRCDPSGSPPSHTWGTEQPQQLDTEQPGRAHRLHDKRVSL